MEIGFILSIIALIVVLYFALRFLKNIITVLVVAAVVLIVLVVGAGFLIWHNANDLRENFSNSTKLMLLADEKGLVFGLEMTTLDMEGVDIIKWGTLDSWQDDYENEKYKNILGDQYMLFILNDEAFEGEIDSAAEMVSELKEYFDDMSVLFLLKEYKEGNIIIYPETPVFKLVKLIPNRLVEIIADTIGEGITFTQPSSTEVILTLAADTPKVIEVSKADEIGVLQIELEVKNKVSNVEITVAKLAEQPASVSTSASEHVYRYLKVTTKKITSEDIKQVKFDFKVEMSWLDEQGFSAADIVLLRYAGDKWNELSTQQVKSDAAYVYYSAESPGFSVFAIALSKVAEPGGLPVVKTGVKKFLQSALFTIAVLTLLATTGVGYVYRNRLEIGAKINDLLDKLRRDREERLKNK